VLSSPASTICLRPALWLKSSRARPRRLSVDVDAASVEAAGRKPFGDNPDSPSIVRKTMK
jgi:hypothetical protein